MANQKVPRKTDAFSGLPNSTRNLDVHGREGDRNAEPTIEHEVEQAVRRVVIRVRVAAEPDVSKQDFGQRIRRRNAYVNSTLDPSRPTIELPAISGFVEIGILVFRERQERAIERQIVAVAFDERAQSSHRAHRDHSRRQACD